MRRRRVILPQKLREIQRIRDSVPLPATIGEMFDERGHLLSRYLEHQPAERALQRLHRRAGEAAMQNGDSLPAGLQQALKLPLVWNQIVKRYPWKIMWVRYDSQGRKKKGEKLCTTLGGAILEWRRIRKIAPNATIVSKGRAYHVPPEYRGKLPKDGWYWCPYCMKPRRYQRNGNDETFVTLKKVWNKEKQRYEWKERPVYRLECPMCSCSNRDPVFRMSNQPWEVRKFKRGVRRARPNHRTRRRRK